MDAQVTTMIPRALADIPDPRRVNRRHKLYDMLVIALFAVLADADGWAAVCHYADRKKDWLKTFLELPHGIPSHDTFEDVFSRLKPEAFEKCFMEWMKTLVQLTEGKVVAIDGKSLCGSYEHSWDRSGMAHIVSAFVEANHMVFAQINTPGKGHELEGIEKLIEFLELNGAIVTIDALGCNHRIVEVIMTNKGNYLLQVKGNQSTLQTKLQATMDEAILLKFKGMDHDYWVSDVQGDHGRLEQRKVWVTWDLSGLGAIAKEWAGLKCLVVVESSRTTFGKDQLENTTETRHYYIGSLDRRYKAKRIGQCVRGHWSVENNLHWHLDVSFNEDDRRLRKGHSAENFSRLCRMSLNLLKNEKTAKAGIAIKRKMCGWDNDYLLTVLKSIT